MSAWDIAGAADAALLLTMLVGPIRLAAKEKDGAAAGVLTLLCVPALGWFVFCIARLLGAHA